MILITCAALAALSPLAAHTPLCKKSQLPLKNQLAHEVVQNPIPPRLQWNHNSGYCGEVCLISAGLYYGQYISQYEARSVATKNTPQESGQLLLGINDQYAAAQLHLNAVCWDSEEEQSTGQFLGWVKQNVVSGHPVAIGVMMNEYRFYGNPDPNAGDAVYDHIVSVTGIGSSYPLCNANYHSGDTIYFSDNGLWGSSSDPHYYFRYQFNAFQADRERANAENGPIYSLLDCGCNFGIAITGVMDLEGDTLPVRLETNCNYEQPEIADGSNTRPPAMPLVLTITASELEPGVRYNLYRYNTLESVPDSAFNAHASDAFESWEVEISSGSTYVMTQEISSDEIAVYRLVPADAP